MSYLRPHKEAFISNIINTNIFLDALAHYVKVITITTDLKDFNLRKLECLDIDYLLVNIKEYGERQFLLREKQKANIRFIIILRTVFAWVEPLVNIIPLIRKEDIIIAPSEYARRSFLKITAKFEVHTIPHCLDVREIQSNISHNFKTCKRQDICFMGRLTEEKGIESLINCMPKVISKEKDTHLNIIGPLSGDGMADVPKTPFVEKLQRKVRESRLNDNVHFLGLKLGLDKYKTLSQSDVFVNPTIAQGETFGIANLEALACGVPVIATNCAAYRELIREGYDDGYLVNINYDKNKKPKIDTEHLIFLIVKVLKDRKLNLRLRRNALKTARRFDYRNVLPRLLRLLKKRKEARVKNRWEVIKNKRVIDFKHLFHKDFLFFLCHFAQFRSQTYALLYKRDKMFFGRNSSNKRYHKRKKDTRTIRMRDKIRRIFFDFLLLKEG